MSTVSNRRSSATAARSGRRSGAADVVRTAMEQIMAATGRPADTVSAVERTDDGWRVEVEIVELERVPATTNILATYELRLDDDHSLLGFRRLRRYYRNAAEEGWS